MQIGIDGQSGTVEQVGAVYTTLRTATGSIKIPNAELARKTIMVAGGEAPSPARQS